MLFSTTPLFKSVLLLTFSLLCFTAQGQDAPVKYGKVSDEEVKMKVYAPDTSAAAVILVDYGRSYFTYTNDFKLVYERVMRIKILKKGGYDWANVEVPYYYSNSDNKEFVSGIKATTYNWEGGKVEKVKMENKAIFEEKKSDNWYMKKFTLPAVKEGSVLDITYTVTSDFFMNFQDWTFQHSIPVAHSEYRASFPEFFDYKHYSQGYERMKISESKAGNMAGVSASTQEYRWVMENVPAITSEAYITTINDYVSRIEFELEWIRFPGQIHRRMSPTWGGLTKGLMEEENFGGQLSKTGFFKKEVAAFETIKDTLERVNTIYNFVKDNVKWNERGGVVTSSNLRKIFEGKTGSAADINLLLVALLRDAGLEANPVIISTREHGRIPQHSPLLSKFNYVVGYMQIGGKDVLLDATDPMRPMGLLPKRCMNGQGWLVTKEGGAWVPLLSEDRTTELVNADLQVLPSGRMTGKVTTSTNGIWALNWRHSVLADGEEKFMKTLVNNQNQLERKKPVFENLKEINKPFGLQYEVASTGDEEAKEIIYLNPMLLKGAKENPFKQIARKYPVDFGHGSEEVYMCSFTIPDGYMVEEMPKSIVVALPENGGKFTYMLQANGNKIQVLSKLTISKPIFYANEYEYLKQFYTQVVAKHAEQIVLRKKG
ncbi:DUF3857 domain-containing protein [Rufibacter roseus]|uniref:DUF3857 domain-containing protein n=1 Tax=Rufibacter roseus TaxID=1567108 RepID=A0ABW2DGA2_9BACT|nr:DUF3857 domain-containing protein [Rufibacter roseus]